MTFVDQLAATYREEAAERIAELEETLLALEASPGDTALVDRAFRAMHTIKGSGAMFGFDEIAGFTHELETVFERVRSGAIPVTSELVAVSLESKDLVRAMLDAPPGGHAAEAARLIAALRCLGGRAAATPGARVAAGPASTPVGQTGYRVRFAPGPTLLRDGTNPLALLEELRGLGACEVVARAEAIPPLEELDPEVCHVSWDIRLTTDRGEDAIRDVFIFAADACDLRIERANPAAPIAAVAADAPAARAVAAGGPPATESSSVRVAAAKLDRLVDLVGEIVIAQARLARLAARHEDPELLSVSEDIERLSGELRDRTLDVRMVPIGTTFARFRRVTRDLAAELGKEIELVTEGAETELDKTVIERLADPLVHLIRNACDHGIESPAARVAAGKPARGTVRLSAYQAGPNVVVEMRDDGAGLDLAAIRRRAVERGLLDPEARASDRELAELIFLPAFSTAREISSISGRGVGMDVVRRSVEALRGTLELGSVQGAGTTLRVELPLTLAIIEGLLVECGGSSFVVPLGAVEECVELTREEVDRGHGARLAVVRGELVPYVRLRELFAAGGGRPEIEQVVIVSAAGVRCGLAVDAVVGHHQTVIKSLGRLYREIPGLSGATILGDGTVALILDVAALTKELGRAAA